MASTVVIPPGARGADYVKLTPEIERWLVANDVRFVLRYCVPPETTKLGKVVTRSEIRWLHEHGIAVLLNYEINHLDADRGAAAGRAAGDWLRRKAYELGVPGDVPLFVSVDSDTWSANVAVRKAYVNAFKEAVKPYPFGVYGDVDIARAVEGEYFWRANANGWGATRADVPVHVQQHRAQYPPGVDPNTALASIPAYLPVPEPEPIANILPANVKLLPGEFLQAEDGTSFWHQTDGNLVLYGPAHEVIWHSDTAGLKTTHLVTQGDGNLVLYCGTLPVWATYTHGQAGTSALVVMPKRAVLYGDNFEILWQVR